jgi:ribosomal protein S18 acetylase RimI-like enzyme
METTATGTRREPPTAAAPTVIVRPATRDDLAMVIDLDARVTAIAKPEYWQEQFARLDEGEAASRYVLVAEAGASGGDRRVVGFIIGEARAWEFGSPPCGWVYAISVDPDVRLSGIGSKLMATISERFRADKVDRIRTMMLRDNHLLMSFFRSHGMMAGPYIQLEMELEE